MKQDQKNILLIILLVILIACAVVFGIKLQPRTSTFTEVDLFAIEDTASIAKITITSESRDIHNTLEETQNGWTINETYLADPNIVRVLLSVLHEVTISRRVPKNQAPSIKEEIVRNGYQVSIYNEDKRISTFYCMGNSTKTRSIMMKEKGKTPYIVHLPGYDSYVAGIFEITALDWRNRLIFQSNWRTLQRLELLYPDYPDDNVEIRFNLDFFEITGVESLDTAAMMDFIDQFQYFQADRFVEPAEGSSYDSLLTEEPYLILSLDDINPKKSNRVIFFPRLNGDPMIMGKLDDDQIALFEYDRIGDIFRKKSDFVQ